jgi:hypothetical protein
LSRSHNLTFSLTLGLTLVTLLALAAGALGADPSAAPAELLESGDLRSDGEGPGLVGNPLLILGAVVVLGLTTALLTLLVARLTRRT